MWGDPLLIVFISVCTAFLGEGDSLISHDYKGTFIFKLKMLSYIKIKKVKY